MWEDSKDTGDVGQKKKRKKREEMLSFLSPADEFLAKLSLKRRRGSRGGGLLAKKADSRVLGPQRSGDSIEDAVLWRINDSLMPPRIHNFSWPLNANVNVNANANANVNASALMNMY